MRIKIFIFIFFISSVSFSQNVTTKLLDKKTGEPISYAYIEYQSLSSNESNVIVANFDGVAENNCTEKCKVIVQSAGYKTYVDTIQPGVSYIFKIDPDYFNLEQITITGTRTEKQLKDVPVLTHVITAEQMQANDAIGIQDVLSIAVPSIIFSRSSTGKVLKMQGLEAKYILFLIDGEKIAGETNGNIDYDRFDVNNVERIEIIKGAASTLYGSNAIGGVINIITKKTKRKFEGNIGSRYSLLNSSGKYFGEFNANAAVGIKLKKVSARTNFHMKNDEGFLFNYDPDNKTKKYFLDPYSTKTVSQKIQYYPIDKLSFELKGNYYERNREDTYLLPSVHKKDKQYSYGVRTLYKPTENINISGSWYSDKYDTYYIDQFYDDKEILLYSNRYNNARIVSDINLRQKQLLSFGLEYIYDDLYSIRIEDTVEHTDNYVFFLQDDINISEKFNTVIGFRVDHHSVYGTHFVPKISFMYKLPHFNLRANYGHGYKSPTLKELFMEFSPVPIVEVYGNPDLKPENSYYYSGSVEYIKNAISSSVSLYQNRLTNMITEVQDIENPIRWSYENINDVVISGIDISFRTIIKSKFSLSATYSYTDSEDKSAGQQLLGTSKNSGILVIGYKNTFKNYRLTVNLQSKYIDKKLFEEMDDITGDLTLKYFDAHNLWKITTTHTIYRGISLTAGIDNIFNYTQQQNITSLNPGRSYFAGLNIYIHKLNF